MDDAFSFIKAEYLRKKIIDNLKTAGFYNYIITGGIS